LAAQLYKLKDTDMNFSETFAAPDAFEMSARLDRVQSQLEQQGLAAYVCFAPANILWLTNFANFIHERPFILVVRQKGRPIFLVPLLELDHVKHRVVGDVEFVTYTEFPAPNGSRWQDRFAEILPDIGKVGIEEMLPHAIVRACGARVTPSDIVDQLREIKSDYELGRIAYGCRLMSDAHIEMLSKAHPGMSQNEINQTIGKSILKRLALDNPTMNPFATSIMTLVQNQTVSHDPHNFTDLDMKMLPEGPHVTVFNSVLNGYGAEVERTFFLGSVPEDAKRPFETMMEARQMTFELTRAGNVLGDVDRAVNQLFAKRGYDKARRHRAGHGMGVTAHEAPFIADGDESVIRSGMVFSIEPGIYLPGLGGFRHSDTVVVTEDGLDCLTSSPELLEDLTL
jgi:Xaa-Pro aminopeptidase